MSEPQARKSADVDPTAVSVASVDGETVRETEHLACVEAWERTHPGQPFPQPWQTPEDARGWRAVARGRNWPARPESDVEVRVVLSPDDYVWLARRADAALAARKAPEEFDTEAARRLFTQMITDVRTGFERKTGS